MGWFGILQLLIHPVCTGYSKYKKTRIDLSINDTNCSIADHGIFLKADRAKQFITLYQSPVLRVGQQSRMEISIENISKHVLRTEGTERHNFHSMGDLGKSVD